MSSFSLKMIAIITMLIDHIGVVFIPYNTQLYLISRSIGRLAFPIFIFLMVEGFHHTRDIKKYLARMGVFALVSELPFDLAFYNAFYPGANLIAQVQNREFSTILTRMMRHQNVYFTLFLGLLLITLINQVERKYAKDIMLSSIINIFLTAAFCFIAALLRTDYDYKGILLVAAFYLFRGSKTLVAISLLIISGGILGGINILETLSMIFISSYNGEKGKSIKYFFYTFYPAHLLLLFVLHWYLPLVGFLVFLPYAVR